MALNLYVNSKDRIFGNASDFEFQSGINNQVATSSFQMRLSEFSMPWLEYGVNSKNNSLIFRENGSGVNITATISTLGNYDMNTFLVALKAALESGGANTYTCTYDVTSKKITIAADGVNTFRMISGGLLNVIGFQTQTSFSNSSTGANVVNLAGTTYIDIYSNIITPNFSIGLKQSGSILARVPVIGAYGTMVTYDGSDSDYFEVTNDDSLANLAFRLYDDQGRLLELPDNAYCSIVLALKYSLDQ